MFSDGGFSSPCSAEASWPRGDRKMVKTYFQIRIMKTKSLHSFVLMQNASNWSRDEVGR